MSNYVDQQRQRIDKFKKLSASEHGILQSAQRDFYWVYGFTPSGRKVTLGPYTNAAEADRRASQLDSAEIHELPTRDRGRAVQMIRSKLLKQGQTIDKALERQLSEKGLKREKKKFNIFRR